MKKTFILLLGITTLWSGLSAGQKYHVSLAACLQQPADPGYQDIYGHSVFLPELKAGFAFSQRLYIWAGLGRLAAEGETAELGLVAKSTQSFLVVGAGHTGSISEKIGFKAELGLADVLYREEALGETVSGSALGVTVAGGLTYALGHRFFLLAEVGYLYAKKTIDGVAVKFGGLKAGLGAGLRF